METYSVQWEELHTVTIPAKSKEEAVEKMLTGDYDNVNEDVEITLKPEAVEV